MPVSQRDAPKSKKFLASTSSVSSMKGIPLRKISDKSCISATSSAIGFEDFSSYLKVPGRLPYVAQTIGKDHVFNQSVSSYKPALLMKSPKSRVSGELDQ